MKSKFFKNSKLWTHVTWAFHRTHVTWRCNMSFHTLMKKTKELIKERHRLDDLPGTMQYIGRHA
jgi:hypothetical protein